jgi:hypothetical protein
MIMIGLRTKFINVSMTFEMLHKHCKKLNKKAIVKVDITRCGHKQN